MIAEPMDLNNDQRWQAVTARDPDATFVYAVRTTGIYCRPACSSKKPRPEQVLYFPQPDEAEQAGFRPCKRCHPRVNGSADPGVEMVRQACRYIEKQPDARVTLAALGKAVGASPFHLQRTFKRVMGVTPRQYADELRLGRFKQELRARNSVTEAIYDAGYGSTSRLYERVGSQLGMVPAAYRRGGAGATISYTTVGCRLGRLLVAATERGLCFISLADSDEDLENGLRAEFFAARVERDDAGLRDWVDAIVRHLDGQEPHLDLPLDVRGTAFQRRVWEELRAIPYGETRTYSEIARAIGYPRSQRAVGRACATNPVSLVVPCHRVVRTDGELAGYGWGVERKRDLLEHERTHAGQSPDQAIGD